jgi:hypothetical protein
MKIKKNINAILAICFCTLLGCAHGVKTFHKQDKLRTPAQSTTPYQQCLIHQKKQCLGTFPYDQLKKKWWQLEYQFLGNKNELHRKYNKCYTRGSIKCAQEFELYELSSQLESLQSAHDISQSIADLKDMSIWNDITIPGLKLAQNTIREIWTHILALKKMYTEIVKNADLKNKIGNVLHGKGVSITGQAFAGVGIGITHEAIIHQKQLALFCAPGAYLKSDVGIGVDFSAIQTLGCKSHNHYKGKFFSLELGVSAEMFGLPVSAGLTYSLGVDITNFLKILAERTESGHFDITQLILELLDISKEKNTELTPEDKYAQNYMAFMLAKTLGEKDLSLKFSENIEQMQQQPFLSKKEVSISYYLKKLLNSFILENKTYIENKPNFYIALLELNNHLSECDAASVSLGLSLSMAPVSAGMALHHYKEVTRIDLEDVLYLAKFTPRMLLSLNLPPSEMAKFKSALKNIMKIIPDLIYSQCIIEAGDKFYLDGKNIIKILRRDRYEN